jgi:hypothetical protein
MPSPVAEPGGRYATALPRRIRMRPWYHPPDPQPLLDAASDGTVPPWPVSGGEVAGPTLRSCSRWVGREQCALTLAQW